jgi:hypothetical protein
VKTSRREVLANVMRIAGAGAYTLSAWGKSNTSHNRLGGSGDTPGRSKSNVGQQVSSVESSAWPKLVAHWKLNGNCRDSLGVHHGMGHNIKFVEDRGGRAEGAALFNGVDGYIEVAHDEGLAFGTRDFSMAFWAKLPGNVDTVNGDILTKYDPDLRRGINISVGGSSQNYSSVCDIRNLYFGIDNGVSGSWTDCGRPWKSNPLIATLTVYKGNLYTGIADASKPEDACHVFRYAGGTDWIDCGRLGSDPLTLSICSMIVHKGQLYAGTGVWNWEKAFAGIGSAPHIYRYEGGTEWQDCGRFGNGYRTMSLASFKGDLYATDDVGGCYRYDGGTNWSAVARLGNDEKLHSDQTGYHEKFQPVMVYRGHLYGGSANGVAYRYDGGTAWTSIGRAIPGATEFLKLQVFDGHLIAGTWPSGKVLKYEGESRWTEMGQTGIATDKFQIFEVQDLTVYNGKLYAGTLPNAQVYRYEGNTDWTLLRRFVRNTNFSPSKPPTWNAVGCLTIFQGQLFMGTSMLLGKYDPAAPAEAGRVYAMEAGKNVSLDDDLGDGWTHVIAVRERGHLKVYVNGDRRVTSPPFDNLDYEVSNRKSLMIGLGAQNYFSGILDDLRIYSGALSPDQAVALHQEAQE